MDKKSIAAIIFFLMAVFISGCVGDVTNLAKANPVISQFLEEHPNANIKVTQYSMREFDAIKEELLSYCNQDNAFITKASVEPGEYYLVGVLDKESKKYIFAFINWDKRAIECAVKGDASQEEINEPPKQKDALLDAEKEFEQTVCSALPENAIYGPDGLGVSIPLTVESELGNRGEAIGFTYSSQFMQINSTAGERKYMNAGWVSSGFSNEYLMIIPITARLKQADGDAVTKYGGIKLTFTGVLQPYNVVITQQATQATLVDGPGVRPETPVQYYWHGVISKPGNPSCPASATCVYESVPVLSRTECKVEFEEKCEEKEGYNFAGQCHYSEFIGNLERDSRTVKNLGQCRYCPSGSRGTWGVLGICSESFNCASSGGGGNAQSYFVSCSECKATPLTSSYNGGSYAWCNYYYNSCVRSGCGKILDNCR